MTFKGSDSWGSSTVVIRFPSGAKIMLSNPHCFVEGYTLATGAHPERKTTFHKVRQPRYTCSVDGSIPGIKSTHSLPAAFSITSRYL